MTMRTTIALILLTGPPLYLFARCLREYGLTFRKADGWGALPLLAMLLLLAHVAVILSAEAGQILNASFFPFRGFLFFLVSGEAFSAAIFPRMFAEAIGALQNSGGLCLEWLIAVPAWICILVVIALAALNHAV